jgi:hypothetical protein
MNMMNAMILLGATSPMWINAMIAGAVGLYKKGNK